MNCENHSCHKLNPAPPCRPKSQLAQQQDPTLPSCCTQRKGTSLIGIHATEAKILMVPAIHHLCAQWLFRGVYEQLLVERGQINTCLCTASVNCCCNSWVPLRWAPVSLILHHHSGHSSRQCIKLMLVQNLRQRLQALQLLPCYRSSVDNRY
jgi:hypothetical protein